MAQSELNQDPKVGRLRGAWLVLMGQRLTPQQIVAQWVEYQCIFDDLLKRWSAYLARDARQEKKRIERLDVPPEQLALNQPRSKAELRSKVAAMRGLGLHGSPMLTAATKAEEE